MSKGEPRRLLEADDLGEALRTDLTRAAGHDVGYDVEAGAARFEATLARGGPPPGDGGGTVAAASGSKGLLAVVATAVVVAGGAIAWSVAGNDDGARPEPVASAASEVETIRPQSEAAPSPEAAPAPASVEPSSVVQEGPPLAPQSPAADVGAEPQELEPTPRPTKGARSRASSTRPAAPAPQDDDRLRREMLATDRARQALGSDPGRALSLAQKADREFADGLFAEDREGIAILALFGLGRVDQAQRRATTFLRAHPRSSYADRIRAATKSAEKP